MIGRLVLQYTRFMQQGGKCSGQLVVADDKGKTLQVLERFDLVEFPQMLRLFAVRVQANPGMECCFQRTDTPGFPITPWAPAHVEQLRNDPEQAIAELSEIKKVTYDMRGTKEQ